LYDLAKDPKKTYITPKPKENVPYLDFSPLDNQLVQLKETAEEFQKMYAGGLQLPVEKQNELNDLLYKVERSLIDPNGLPRRAWYKHEIYAPGYYTGYGVKTLPGIREAIEQRNWTEAQQGIQTVSKVLQTYVTQVKQGVEILKQKKAF
jgi:N-acetylated-alpha-linked acidic dipeptidase